MKPTNPKFSINPTGDVKVLYKDGNPCPCPFRSPFVNINQITGQPQIDTPICSSVCQFFHLETAGQSLSAPADEPRQFVEAWCTGSATPRLFELEQPRAPLTVI